MKIKYVDLSVKDEDEIDNYMVLFENILREGKFILGEHLTRFEEEFASYCGVGYAVGVNSGSDAVFLSLKALAIGEGDEVITVANSYIATVGAIAATGATPVLIDVNYDDMLINDGLIDGHITDKTKAIVPVHLTGTVCDMAAIKLIADKYGLDVIEDACQAVGALYRGSRAGSLGKTGCFSFHPLKNISAPGDGGIITTNDENIYEKAVMLRNHGLKDRDTAVSFGYNSRLDEIHAAVLRVRLKRINEITAAKRRVAERYIKCLSDLKGKGYIDYYCDDFHRMSVFHLFVIKTCERDALMVFLNEEGIETKVHYPIPIHRQKAFVDRFGEVSLPITERLSREILSLPSGIGMKESEVDRICESITNFFMKR